MIVHEPHPFLVSVDPGDAAPERRHQVVNRSEQHIGQHGSFQMTPQSFDQVQARAVGRQPENLEVMSVGLQPRLHHFRMMDPTVVADQTDLATGLGFQQRDQEDKELRSALLVGYSVGDPPAGEVDAAVDHLLLVFARRGNFGLDTGP